MSKENLAIADAQLVPKCHLHCANLLVVLMFSVSLTSIWRMQFELIELLATTLRQVCLPECFRFQRELRSFTRSSRQSIKTLQFNGFIAIHQSKIIVGFVQKIELFQSLIRSSKMLPHFSSNAAMKKSRRIPHEMTMNVKCPCSLLLRLLVAINSGLYICRAHSPASTRI